MGQERAQPTISSLFRRGGAWSLLPGERAALEGVLGLLRPAVSIEIGTHTGESLEPISRHSQIVHSFDLIRRPEVSDELFPNVEFHIGDSHELLSGVLQRLSADGVNVEFVFVDGDHSAAGVRRDVEDLLAAASIGRSVLLLHDTLSESVRTGLEQVDYDAFEKVRFVDYDFVAGQVVPATTGTDEVGRGLGLIISDWELDTGNWPARYQVNEVWAAFAEEVLGKQDPSRRPGFAERRELEERVAEQRQELEAIENSWSWKVTKPLRSLGKMLH